MADYSFEVTAQQWRDDPYYVASGYPLERVTVVASDKTGAMEAAKVVLGDADRGRHWRFWFGKVIDVRLVKEE